MTQSGYKRLNLRDSKWFNKKSSRCTQNKLKFEIKNKKQLNKYEASAKEFSLDNVSEITNIKFENIFKTSDSINKQKPFDLDYKPSFPTTASDKNEPDNSATPARYNIFLNSALGFDESRPSTSPYDSSINPQQIFYIPCQSIKGLKSLSSNTKLGNQTDSSIENQCKGFHGTLKKDKTGLKKIEKFLQEKLSSFSVVPIQQEGEHPQKLLSNLNKNSIRKLLDHPISTTGSTTIGSNVTNSYHGESYNKNDLQSKSLFIEPKSNEMHSNLGNHTSPSAQMLQENTSLSTNSTIIFKKKNNLSKFHTELKEPSQMENIKHENGEGSFIEGQNGHNSLFHAEHKKSNLPISSSYKNVLNSAFLAHSGTRDVEYDINNIKLLPSPEMGPQLSGSLPFINVAYTTYNQNTKDITNPYSLNYIQYSQYFQGQDMRIGNGPSDPALIPDKFRNPQMYPYMNNNTEYKSNTQLNETVAETNFPDYTSTQTLLSFPHPNKICSQFSLRSPRKYFAHVCTQFQHLSRQQYDWLLRSEQYKD